MNVIAAAQGQVQQVLQLFEDGEAVGHQQSAVTVTQRGRGEYCRAMWDHLKNTTSDKVKSCLCPPVCPVFTFFSSVLVSNS